MYSSIVQFFLNFRLTQVISAPLLAVRCYSEKLDGLHTSCGYEVTKRHKAPKIFSLDTLLAMKELITKDRVDRDQYKPHFTELLLKWVEITKPSYANLQSFWHTIVADPAFYSKSTYDMLMNFQDRICHQVERERHCYLENPNDVSLEVLHNALALRKAMQFLPDPVLSEDDKYHDHKYVNLCPRSGVDGPLSIFKEVNEIGHFVLSDIHCVLNSEGIVGDNQSPCITYCKCRNSCGFLTLTIESGYYVIRNSTKKECREVCKNECFKHDQMKPVLFYTISAHHKHRVFTASMTLNRKEVIDEMIQKTFTNKPDGLVFEDESDLLIFSVMV